MIDVFAKYQGLPIVWGESDCCQFVGECVASVYGINPAHHVRYASENAANRLIQYHGGLAGVLDVILGPSMPRNKQRDGDVGLVDNGAAVVAGVFWRDRIVCRVETGLVDLPAHRSPRMWRPCLN